MNDKISNFIEKLIKKTQFNKIQWKRIKDIPKNSFNKNINKFLTPIFLDIKEQNSFISTYRNGVIILLNYRDKIATEFDNYILAVQSDFDSEVVILNTINEYQADLLRLANMIQRQLGNVESFIDDFLLEP